MRALLTLRNAPQYGETNDVERFEPCDPPAGFTPPVNPFAQASETASQAERTRTLDRARHTSIRRFAEFTVRGYGDLAGIFGRVWSVFV